MKSHRASWKMIVILASICLITMTFIFIYLRFSCPIIRIHCLVAFHALEVLGDRSL